MLEIECAGPTCFLCQQGVSLTVTRQREAASSARVDECGDVSSVGQVVVRLIGTRREGTVEIDGVGNSQHPGAGLRAALASISFAGEIEEVRQGLKRDKKA
jgi:hypothetical protein